MAAGAKPEVAAGESARREPARNERAARRQRSGGRASEAAIRAPGAVGERPQAPWHPLPLSELLILVGMIGSIVGFSRGKSGTTVLFAGIGAVMLGTLEFTIREHLSGYRSHASLLAAIPTALLHGALALTLFALGAPNASLVIAPLVLDVPVFAVLFKALRARFADARRERVFAGGR